MWDSVYLLPQTDYTDTNNAVNLEALLRKHKQNFIALLRNPPKNAKCREAIRQGITDGITLPEFGHTILSKELVDESIILSDMFDLNEYVALELLCTSQQQTVNHPGLTRGLVAVLLYYDGRKSLVASLKQLFKSRAGVSWCTDASPEVTNIITSYTDGLVADGMLERIIDLLNELDITKELDILTTNRALGPPKHHRQVLDLFEEIRLLLAQCLYYCAAQAGLPRSATVKLIQYLRGYKYAESSGGIDDVTVTLQMALLYAFDLSVLLRREDGEELVKNLPMIKDELYIDFLMDALSTGWENDGLHALSLFTFGLSIATLRLAPQTLFQETGKIIEQDELLVNGAIQGKVFDFLYYTFFESELIYETEFFYRRIHTLFADFIELMHSKVTELRGRADETARTVQLYQQQGVEPPANLCHNFETLLLSVGKFYGNDRLQLHLSVEYWGPSEFTSSTALRSSSRSVCLFKFIRLAGELLPPTLFIPYLKMLAGLSCNPQSARSAFNLLKQSNASHHSFPQSGNSTMSWDHFFNSLTAYFQSLRLEQSPHTETVYRNRMMSKSINPQEILGLQAVLQVIQSVARYDEISCLTLCENSQWLLLDVLVGLISCSVPIQLKAEIVRTLSALAGTYEIAIQLWKNLEDSQIISTVPSTSNFQTRGVKSELEEVESRNETYPLTNAMVDFLASLMRTAIPQDLGGSTRVPGIHPYLSYVIDTVLLRLFNRSYKDGAEKWQLAQKCLQIVYTFVRDYKCDVLAASTLKDAKEYRYPPAYQMLLQMNTKSELLRLLLHIVDESVVCFDTYAPFPGKSALEATSLLCLQIIERVLNIQENFFTIHLNSPNPAILVGLGKLLLGMNPRSGKADHMLNVMKHITYSSWLPENSLIALRILTMIMAQPDVNQLILALVTQTDALKNEIRQGFVECLETDINITEEVQLPPTDSRAANNTSMLTLEPDPQSGTPASEVYVAMSVKRAVIHLIQECLQQPVVPNIAHYLLGYDLTKELQQTNLQQPGVMNFPSNCSKSLITLLDKHLENIRSGSALSTSYSKLIEQAYCLLYCICRNYHTSEVFLRFLRSCNDFLCRHTAAFPFPFPKNPYQLNQMTFLLKAIVIELKLTSERNQATQFEMICKILLKIMNMPTGGEVSTAGLGEQHYYTNTNLSIAGMSSMSMSSTAAVKESSETAKRLLCILLDCVDFEIKQLEEPHWKYFNSEVLHEVLQRCEIPVNRNAPHGRRRLIDIRKLHDYLLHELGSIHFATGQRAHIVQEIKTILQYAVLLNGQQEICTSTIQFLEAWGQVTEVLVSVTPAMIMSLETKQIIITEILQIMLGKAVSKQILAELANIASSTVSLLMVNLRSCFLLKSEQQSLRLLSERSHKGLSNLGVSTTEGTTQEELNATSRRGRDVANYSILEQANVLSLKFILKNILDWLLVSSDGSPQLKMNLYVALLNYMHIIKGNQDNLERGHTLKNDKEEMDSFLNNTIMGSNRKMYGEETEDYKQLKMIMDIFNAFGDSLIDVMCQDCTTGHDICKMLAMSCLDMLLSIDASVDIIEFVARHGYLTHIVNSLLKHDDALRRILDRNPNSFRALYVYESKMALLSRIAQCQIGARLLLEEGLLGILGSMKVFDQHRDVQLRMNGNHLETGSDPMGSLSLSGTSSSFIPPMEARYQQILFPALNLCASILSTLGQENSSVICQIIYFFVSHSDMIETVLRAGSPRMNLGLLKELASITNLVARAVNQELFEQSDPDANKAFSSQLHRIHKFMMCLFPRFIVSEQMLKDLQPSTFDNTAISMSGNFSFGANTTVTDQRQRSQHVKYILEVAANLSLYARNCISNHVVDHRSVNVIFSPQYGGAEGASIAPLRKETLAPSYNSLHDQQSHSLYTVITQLRSTVEYYHKERNILESLQQQRNSLPSIDLDKNIQLQYIVLTERATAKQEEMQRCIFIIEHCLYILWAHLDFFVLQLLPTHKSMRNTQGIYYKFGSSETGWTVTNEDIAALKKTLIGVFNETFCKQLLEIDQKQSEKGYVVAFIRRIKQSIQFVPVK
ncbi:nuclear pore complex protein Nup205 [Anopheles bellator]|uniref:nuclear pore complex protein Nup205 n=1 Tax=Anopheles bellator TaxID=139047 RepID=UPI002648034B|nr:nuclear pore complex protein Nup205 [Anopheles bellator]